MIRSGDISGISVFWFCVDVQWTKQVVINLGMGHGVSRAIIEEKTS
jgi:hypothetical protein